MKEQKGFTLIELMVTVVIIGILSAVAIPAYSDYVIRGKIPDATSLLAMTKTSMEQFYQDNHRYTTAAAGTTCGVTPSNGKFFTLTCAATDTVNSQSFIVTATGNTAGDTSMNGFSYTIDQSGTKTSTIAAPANANWIGTQASCWITKSAATC